MRAESDQARVVWPKWLAVLKISKVPFWFIWATPVVFGYLASGDREGSYTKLGWFFLFLLGLSLLESANCIHNELVDQEEDRINQPNRAGLVESVGEGTLLRIALVGYLICILGAGAIAVFVGPLVAGIATASGVAAPLYNWGPRFKRRPILAEVAIGWAAFLGFLTGWVWNNQTVISVPPEAWVLAFFFAATSLIKDLPEVSGDEAVNAASVFSVRRPATRRVLLLVIYVSPYVLSTILVALGILPGRLLYLVALLPIGLLVMIAGERARELHTFIMAYELAFFYIHLFFVVLMATSLPQASSVVVGASLFLSRALATYWGLAPRFVEPKFSWGRSLRAIVAP